MILSYNLIFVNIALTKKQLMLLNEGVGDEGFTHHSLAVVISFLLRVAGFIILSKIY